MLTNIDPTNFSIFTSRSGFKAQVHLGRLCVFLLARITDSCAGGEQSTSLLVGANIFDRVRRSTVNKLGKSKPQLSIVIN